MSAISNPSVPRHGARVFHSANQSINDSTWTTLAFDSERFDPFAMHDTVTNNGRFTIQRAGRYAVACALAFAANSTGQRGIRIRKDPGGTPVDLFVGTSAATPAALGRTAVSSPSVLYDFVAGDEIDFQVVQTSGGALNVEAVSEWSPEAFINLELVA